MVQQTLWKNNVKVFHFLDDSNTLLKRNNRRGLATNSFVLTPTMSVSPKHRIFLLFFYMFGMKHTERSKGIDDISITIYLIQKKAENCFHEKDQSTLKRVLYNLLKIRHPIES